MELDDNFYSGTCGVARLYFTLRKFNSLTFLEIKNKTGIPSWLIRSHLQSLVNYGLFYKTKEHDKPPKYSINEQICEKFEREFGEEELSEYKELFGYED